MTRIDSRRPRRVTPLTLLGILLLPALIGGILVTALSHPGERLDRMSAAIVNLDEPVTIEGQYLPLGRQLAAGLVEGSDEFDSNLNWVISNEADAARGLSDGTYQAVVTIPAGFSSAATSPGRALSGAGTPAERAEITVLTAPDSLLADDLITAQIAGAATSTMGELLSTSTLENVLIGFTTIGEQLGHAAEGAAELATGAEQAAGGAAEVPGGARQLASGAGALSSGAAQLGTGLDTIAEKTREAAGGAQALGQGLTAGASVLETAGIVPAELRHAAQGAAAATGGVSQGVNDLATRLSALSASCPAGAGGTFCAELSGLAQDATALRAPASQATILAEGTATGLEQLATDAPTALAAQMREAGTAAEWLGTGLGQLAAGVSQSANGARELGGGASLLSSGASSLAQGTEELAEGLGQLAEGTRGLADGLDTATGELPSFSEEESATLAAVVASPVTANTGSGTLFGSTAIPLLATVVLWLGALASFVPLRGRPAGILTSRRSSASLAWGTLWPALVIGAGQGALVAIVVQLVARYDAGTWWAFAGMSMLAGLSFTAVNHALVAVLGGAGRWLSGLVGAVALATGIISTVPAWLSGIAAALPTAPAFAGLTAAGAAAVAALLVWAVLAFVAATLAVAARRTTSARAVLATAP